MSLVEKLLQMDKIKVTELPTKEVEVKRLSELTGEPFMIKCRAIDGEKYAEIQRMSINLNKTGGFKDVKLFDMQVMTVIDGVIEPSMSDKELLKHFDCITPKQLVNKLFLSGEIADISKAINELSGYDKTEKTEEEIKN